MKLIPPEWVRTSDPVIRSPARYRWTTAPAPETVMVKALDSQIAKGEGNILFHSEWDNLNKILTNVHGSNVVNSAGGIMIQETAFGYESSITRSLSNI